MAASGKQTYQPTQSEISSLNNASFVELLLVVGWYIWWERKQVIHG
jgi:hypothetical protein